MKYYNIQLPPTQRTLFLFVGEYDQKQFDKTCGKGVNICSDWQGAYITHEVDNDIEPVMWIKDPKSKATFIHECVHCTSDLMDATHINDEEFRAWYTEWLYNTIQDALKLSK